MPGTRARRLGGAVRRRERPPRAAVRLDCSLTSFTMASMFAAARAVLAQLHPIRVVAPVLARHIATRAAVHAFERYDKSITASGHQSVPQGRGSRCAHSASPRARPRHWPRDSALYTARQGVRSPSRGAFSVRHSRGGGNPFPQVKRRIQGAPPVPGHQAALRCQSRPLLGSPPRTRKLVAVPPTGTIWRIAVAAAVIEMVRSTIWG